MSSRNYVLIFFLLTSVSPLAIATLFNLTLPIPHPYPDEVVQDVQRYNVVQILLSFGLSKLIALSLMCFLT